MINKNIYFLLLLVLLSLIFWGWWTPGEKASQDLPYVSQESLKSLFSLPFVWSEYGSEGLGQYTVFTLWSWPLNLLSGLLAHLGFNFSAITRAYLGLFLILGSLSIWKFTKYLKFTLPAQFIASLLYLANTYILLVLDGGQLNIAIAYALIPAVFVYLDQALTGSFRDRVLAAIGVYLVSVCDIRFIYLLALLVSIRALFKKTSLKDLILTGGVTAIILTSLHLYWLYPLLKSPLAPGVYSSLTESSVNSSLINLGHSLTLLAPHWHHNTFGVITPLRPEFFLIPILVFIAVILRKRDQEVGFWTLSAIIFVFLAKGPSEPLGYLYTLAYIHLPGFSLFRDSTKFFFLVALSYSALLGFTVDALLKVDRLSPKLKSILPISLTFILLILIQPVWSQKMRGTFSNLPFQPEHQAMQGLMESDSQFSRILWIPSLPPLGYFSPTHPAIETSRLYNKRPFVSGVLGSYEKYNFLREAPYAGELLDIAGVGYINYPPLDPRQPNLDTDTINYYQIFSRQLSSLPWAEQTQLSTLLKTRAHQDRFFMTQNSWVVIGSDSIYQEATKSAQAKLSSNALIFVDEKPGVASQLIEKANIKIVLYHKTLTDLAASFIDDSNLIFPAKILGHSPDKTGWWKRDTGDFLNWKDFLRAKYNLDNQDFDLKGGWAVGEGEVELRIQSEELKEGYILLARVMESSRSEELRFSQDGQLIGNINTIGKTANFKWHQVGVLSKSGAINISSSGDINVINALAVISAEEWSTYQIQAKQMEGKVQPYPSSQGDALQTQPQISYQMINPTKYQITITGLNSPQMLVFSQSYDPRWKLGGQSSVPVYSFLNGFWIKSNGEYIVEFKPL